MASKKPRKDASTDEGNGRSRPREATGDSLNAYIREIAKFKPLHADEEKVLGRRIQQGDQEALKHLVECNLRFVVSYAKRYRGLGLSYLDLIHEGTLGLMEAAKRFDPERGVKFISYAVWWVRQAIFHALSEHARVFRLPQKLSGQVSKVEGARDRLARGAGAAAHHGRGGPEDRAHHRAGGEPPPRRGGRRLALRGGGGGREHGARGHAGAGHDPLRRARDDALLLRAAGSRPW